MAFLIDEAFLPATLTAPPMSDEEFAAFCAEHPDLFFEMSADGELIVMPPTFSFTGARNNQIGRQLGAWAEQDGRGICAPLRNKMDEWLASGAQLGWLIDPDTRNVEIYRPGHEPRVVAGLSEVTGEAPVSGFSLYLARVWDPLSA